MSVSLWAYDDLKCDGYPCPHDCDICPVKDEHRCYECRFFEADPASTWGECRKNLYATRETDKACEDFEEMEGE